MHELHNILLYILQQDGINDGLKFRNVLIAAGRTDNDFIVTLTFYRFYITQIQQRIRMYQIYAESGCKLFEMPTTTLLG